MSKCINCGKSFTKCKYNPRKMYCCHKCARQYYYKTHIEKEKQGCKKWYKENRESELEKNKIYRQQNKELFKWYHNRDRFNGMREIILERDLRKCFACGSENYISIHHKDNKGYYKAKNKEDINNDLDNLITLCGSCHHRLHGWQRRNNKLLLDNEEIKNILVNLSE